jgi:hypothetical protein
VWPQVLFGLTEAVRQLDRVSLPLARAFLPSTRPPSTFVTPTFEAQILECELSASSCED